MLFQPQSNLIGYKKITIYQQSYQLPIFQNHRLKNFHKKIKERRRLIQEGFRYHYYLGWGLRRKEKLSQQTIFWECQLLIKDYSLLINALELYHENYYAFLRCLNHNLKQLFSEKYRDLKILDYERIKLEIKNSDNPQILEGLKREKAENFRAILLLGRASFLMLEKTNLLGKGVIKLSQDTQNQKQNIQRIVQELSVYNEINEYQAKAQKIRQEIAKLADNAVNFDRFLQDYFTPFQSLIEDVIKLDEQFYATVGEIKGLVDNICLSKSYDLSAESENSQKIDQFLLNFMVTGYEKSDRLKEAFLSFKSLDSLSNSVDFFDQFTSWEQTINNLSVYLSEQFTHQIALSPIPSVSLSATDVDYCTVLESLNIEQQTPGNLAKLLGSKSENHKQRLDQVYPGVDFTLLQNLLRSQEWKTADIETTHLLLKVMGKRYWHEVYQEDIENFPYEPLKIIDQLWIQHSHGYFGLSIQQNIWRTLGGGIDYETDKKLGERLGWRQQGRWLNYEQLIFDLSSATPIGHLPAHWLNYDQNYLDPLSLSSPEIKAVSAWRVDSWLLWQMHLFLTRVEACKLQPSPDFSSE